MFSSSAVPATSSGLVFAHLILLLNFSYQHLTPCECFDLQVFFDIVILKNLSMGMLTREWIFDKWNNIY